MRRSMQTSPRVACNDKIRATVTMRQPERYLDPGVWDERGYMLNEGIGAFGSGKLRRSVLFPGQPTQRFHAGCIRYNSVQARACLRLRMNNNHAQRCLPSSD